MDTLVLAASAAGAAAVSLVTYSAWALTTEERTRVSGRVSRSGVATRGPVRVADVRVSQRTRGLLKPTDDLLGHFSWAENAREELARAEISLHLSEFILLRIALAAAVFLMLAIPGGRPVFYVFGAMLALVVWWQIGAYPRRRIERRKRSIDNQLDAALVNISGSLRAGFSFLQACQMSVNQLQWPLRDEIEEMLEELNLGASLDSALAALPQRTESYEVGIAVNAVLVQRQIGGNLADILENVARTIRDRRELRGHIMALTAQQRLSSYFVAGVPPFMAILLSLMNWQFMRPLFFSLAGNVLVTIGIILDMIGFLAMRRLTRIDF